MGVWEGRKCQVRVDQGPSKENRIAWERTAGRREKRWGCRETEGVHEKGGDYRRGGSREQEWPLEARCRSWPQLYACLGWVCPLVRTLPPNYLAKRKGFRKTQMTHEWRTGGALGCKLKDCNMGESCPPQVFAL